MRIFTPFLLSVFVTLTACDGNSRPFEEAVEIRQLDLASITVTPPEFSLPTIYLNPGQTLQLGLEGIDSSGDSVALSGSDRLWTSSDPAVFDVDENGLLTAFSNGDAIASVRIGGLAATGFQVFVAQSDLSSIQTIEGLDIVDRCVPADYRAIGRFVDGTDRLLDNVTWSVDNPASARVDASTGELIGENVAMIQLTATADGIPGSRDVEVSSSLTLVDIGTFINAIQVGSSLDLSASGTYSTGSADSDPTRQVVITDAVQWSVTQGSSALSVGNTGATKGTITGLATGSAIVRASCGDESDERVINVSDNNSSASDDLSFNVTGSSVSLSLSANPQFLLRVSTGDEFDEDLEVSDEVTWTQTDNGSSTSTEAFELTTSGVNAGLITTLAVGSANVTASLNGDSITLIVNVVSP